MYNVFAAEKPRTFEPQVTTVPTKQFTSLKEKPRGALHTCKHLMTVNALTERTNEMSQKYRARVANFVYTMAQSPKVVTDLYSESRRRNSCLATSPIQPHGFKHGSPVNM